jgi:hypothetical protein
VPVGVGFGESPTARQKVIPPERSLIYQAYASFRLLLRSEGVMNILTVPLGSLLGLDARRDEDQTVGQPLR